MDIQQFDTQIEAYFTGTLSPIDKNAFEESLKANKVLQEAIKPYLMFNKAVEAVVIIASGRQIELDDLPEAISRKATEAFAHARQERATAAGEGRAIGIQIELPSAMDEIEKQVIEATLDYTQGDKSRAARLLNIGRKTLYRKLEQFESEM